MRRSTMVAVVVAALGCGVALTPSASAAGAAVNVAPRTVHTVQFYGYYGEPHYRGGWERRSHRREHRNWREHRRARDQARIAEAARREAWRIEQERAQRRAWRRAQRDRYGYYWGY